MLPTELRVPAAIIVLLAIVLCTTLAVLYGGHSAPSQLDIALGGLVTGLIPEPGPTVYLIDFVGEPVGALSCVTVLAVTCWAARRRRLAVVTVLSMGGAWAITTGLKPLVDRTIHGGFLAYPSGHTATATVFSVVVVLLLIDLARPPTTVSVVLIVCGAGVGASAMAFAEVSLDAHYPTDTIGGFCVGLALVPTISYLHDRWSARRSRLRIRWA